MDEIELELNLVAIFSAIRLGDVDAARKIFENSLHEAVDSIVDEVIEIVLEKKGSCILIGEIEELINNCSHWQ